MRPFTFIHKISIALSFTLFLNATPSFSQTDSIHAETLLELKKLSTQINTWAPMCSDGSLTFHECPFGDAIEYMGMLCLAGETQFCDQVKKAQDSSGRWWRSPGLVGKEETDDGGPTFSNDMSRGVWAYLVATQDKEAAQKWMNYIENNDWHLCKKSAVRFDSCQTRVMFWTFAAQVFDYLGLPRNKKMKGYKFLIERAYAPLEASFQPKGYQMLLTAEMVFTIQKLQEKGARIKNKRIFNRIAETIYSREPQNPFYRYLVKGADQKTAELVLQYCPNSVPLVPVDSHGPIYAIEFSNPMKNGHMARAGGHYCKMMIDLLVGANSTE